ncbi:hypothetical protein EI94DRAFT_1708106 [Lactarius quietus]|nr:hypothetical protein EI94DRAFT_1708106 [Lactarius quietus]
MPIAVPSIGAKLINHTDQSPHLHRRDLKEAIKSMHPPASSLDWSLGFLSRSSNRSDNQTPHGGELGKTYESAYGSSYEAPKSLQTKRRNNDRDGRARRPRARVFTHSRRGRKHEDYPAQTPSAKSRRYLRHAAIAQRAQTRSRLQQRNSSALDAHINAGGDAARKFWNTPCIKHCSIEIHHLEVLLHHLMIVTRPPFLCQLKNNSL